MSLKYHPQWAGLNIALLMFALSMPSIITAQQTSCLKGRYILEATPIRAVNTSFVSELEGYSGTPLVIEEERKHITLVTTEAVLRTNETSSITDSRSTNLCTKARLGRRKKVSYARAARKAFPRNFRCGCDQLLVVNKVPNDAYYHAQWGVKNSNEGIDINLQSAWDKSTGSKDVVIGVIDSGVDYNHPDLSGNMWTNPFEVPSNGIDDDNNGVIDDIHGYNAINNSGNPMDDAGHGTHVAGTIGASANNSIGVAGVSWNVKLVAIKFLSSNGQGMLSDAIKSIDYATNLRKQGVNIILTNNSWGGASYSTFLYDAIERSRNADMLFVAAAGNESKYVDGSPSYPASFPHANIISVAALNRDGTLASFSNYGADSVDVAAPGVSIASTYPGNAYVYLSGTSMAAPHVSGLLALAKGYLPQSSQALLKSALFTSVKPLSNLNGYMKYPGIIDATAMFALLESIAPPSAPTPTPRPTATATPVPTATPTPLPTPTSLPGYYTVTIQVQDAQGHAIRGAQVELLSTNGKSYYALSNSNGIAVLTQVLGPVSYTLVAKKAGHLFTARMGSLSSHVSLTMQSAGTQLYALSVHVLDTQKSPLSGIIINAGALGSAVTDGSGLATFTVPVGTQYSLSVEDSSLQFAYPSASGEVLGTTTRVFIAKY